MNYYRLYDSIYTKTIFARYQFECLEQYKEKCQACLNFPKPALILPEYPIVLINTNLLN